MTMSGRLSASSPSVANVPTAPTASLRAGSAADGEESSRPERLWQEIHSMLRNSQPDELVTEWADAPTEFRIGDNSPLLMRNVSGDDVTLRQVSRTSSTSSTSSAASAHLVARHHPFAHCDRSPDSYTKPNIPLSDKYVACSFDFLTIVVVI
jgi:hypothetical protein